jgi:copper chaperone CopZ
MKKMAIVSGILFASLLVWAGKSVETAKVYGNCGMCKNRIEKAAKEAGAKAAEWNNETKVLTVTFKSEKASMEDILKKIAAAGHDSESFKSTDEVYNKLPGCCKYDRTGKTKTSH